MKFPRRYTIFCIGLLAMAAATVQGQAQVLSFEQAKQRADAGDAYTQAVVALHYQLGWNTEKNPELAVKYALASAKAGSPLGQFRLGALLRAGEGVPKDEQQGLALQAASFDGLDRMTGDPYALTSLGVMIFQGKAVWQNVPQEKRRQQAAQLYKRAADAGFAPAIFNYAMCLDAGHGVAEDKSAASHLVSRAQELQYPLALAQAREVVMVEESIPEDMAGAVLNPETFVWEAKSNTGSSSQWHSLVGAESPISISVDLRANYHGFPAAVNAGSDSFAHTKSLEQSLFNSWQHVVTRVDKDSLTVAMPVPAESKNVLSITEYPIALEFRLTNAGYIDAWGRGIEKMTRACAEAGLPPPTFEANSGGVLATFSQPPKATPHVTPEVTPEVAPEVIKMLGLLRGAMTRGEIMSILGLRDEKHFREHYQQVASNFGLIEMTIPEKPKSPLQKYRLTAKGRALLEKSNHTT